MVLQKFPGMFLDMIPEREKNPRALGIVKKNRVKRIFGIESVGSWGTQRVRIIFWIVSDG